MSIFTFPFLSRDFNLWVNIWLLLINSSKGKVKGLLDWIETVKNLFWHINFSCQLKTSVLFSPLRIRSFGTPFTSIWVLFFYYFLNSHLRIFFLLIFIDLEKERGRERNIDLLPLVCTLTGNQTRSLFFFDVWDDAPTNEALGQDSIWILNWTSRWNGNYVYEYKTVSTELLGIFPK